MDVVTSTVQVKHLSQRIHTFYREIFVIATSLVLKPFQESHVSKFIYCSLK